MYNVSEAYKKAANLQTRESKVYGTLTQTNGTVIEFTSADILAGSLSIDNAAVNGQELNLGTVYAAKFQFSLKTDADRYSLYDAEVKLTYSLKLGDGTWEDVPLGVFYVSEAQRAGKYVALNGYDAMLNFDKEISIMSSGTAYDLLNKACVDCGVELAQTRDEIDIMGPGLYENGAISPYSFGIPADTNISTYRNLISEVAVLLGGFCIMDRQGKLRVCRFGEKTELDITDRLRKKAEIYDYKCEYSGLAAVIGGTTRLIGTNDRIVIDLGKPNLLQNCPPAVKTTTLEHIWECIEDLTYTPCDIEYIGDPALDLGDIVKVSGYNADNTDGTYMCIMTYNWKFHGTHKLTAVGKNTKLAKAKAIQSNKTSSNMSYAVSEAKTKTLIYTNTDEVYIYYISKPVLSFDIPVERDTSITINGQVIIEVSSPGIFQIVYEIDGERVEYSPKQTISEVGYYTMNILYALSAASVDEYNNFTIYLKSENGFGRVKVGNCIAIASGFGIATISDDLKKLQFEEEMQQLRFSFSEISESIEDTVEITLTETE